MNITIPRRLVRRFQQECKKRYPIEHLAAVFGSRDMDGNITVADLRPITCESDASQIIYTDDAIFKSKIAALKKESDWLGTIHSHCWTKEEFCCEHLSRTDIRTAIRDGETLCGIVYVYDNGKKASVHWYVPAPIPEVTYCY